MTDQEFPKSDNPLRESMSQITTDSFEKLKSGDFTETNVGELVRNLIAAELVKEGMSAQSSLQAGDQKFYSTAQQNAIRMQEQISTNQGLVEYLQRRIDQARSIAGLSETESSEEDAMQSGGNLRKAQEYLRSQI